ncbi:MAG: helix-turn-helix domain-containing protein [Cyanobacteria bacterium J06634_6]
MVNESFLSYVPSEEDARLSKESSRVLSAHIGDSAAQLKVVEKDGSEQAVAIPASAYQLLVDVLTQMSQGNAVTLIPVHAELTTQEAADFMNVSRPYLIKQIEAGELACRKVGRHRRIRFDDLVAYKKQTDADRARAIDEMVALSEEMGLYD